MRRPWAQLWGAGCRLGLLALAVARCEGASPADHAGIQTSEAEAEASLAFDLDVTCETFCNTVVRHCRRVNQMYPSQAACEASCAEWPADAPALSPQGNSLQCRMLYAVFAARVHERIGFCRNAGADGGQMCR